MKHLCKKTFIKKRISFSTIDEVIFEKDVWYVERRAHSPSGGDRWYYSIFIKEGTTKYYSLNGDEFNEYFYQDYELRELEIDKVLEL